MKGFTLVLALKQRLKATRKSPIVFTISDWERISNSALPRLFGFTEVAVYIPLRDASFVCAS